MKRMFQAALVLIVLSFATAAQAKDRTYGTPLIPIADSIVSFLTPILSDDRDTAWLFKDKESTVRIRRYENAALDQWFVLTVEENKKVTHRLRLYRNNGGWATVGRNVDENYLPNLLLQVKKTVANPLLVTLLNNCKVQKKMPNEYYAIQRNYFNDNNAVPIKIIHPQPSRSGCNEHNPTFLELADCLWITLASIDIKKVEPVWEGKYIVSMNIYE